MLLLTLKGGTLNMNNRLRELRKELNLTLEKFGKNLGVGKTAISKLEQGENNLTEQMLNLICKTNWNGKMVNENWLRTGEGSMFIELSNESTYYEAAAQLSNDPFAVAVLTEYYKRDDNFKKALANFVFDVSKHFNKDEE